MIFKLFLFEVI